MYIVNNAITITWILAPNATPLGASDFDLKIVLSDLDGTYTDAAIINYVAPTINFAGSIQYLFTPTTPGLHKLYLTTGVAATYLIINKKDFWVFCAAPTNQPSTKVLGLTSIIPVACP